MANLEGSLETDWPNPLYSSRTSQSQMPSNISRRFLISPGIGSLQSLLANLCQCLLTLTVEEYVALLVFHFVPLLFSCIPQSKAWLSVPYSHTLVIYIHWLDLPWVFSRWEIIPALSQTPLTCQYSYPLMLFMALLNLCVPVLFVVMHSSYGNSLCCGNYISDFCDKQ